VRERPDPDQNGAFLVPLAVEVLCFINAPPPAVHPGKLRRMENILREEEAARGNGPTGSAV
jgi:hypothetical protein